MACVSPIKIKSPIHQYDKTKYIYVPCGRCAWCRRDKRNEWFIRFKVEQNLSRFTKFITLTYADDTMPFYLDEDTGEFGYRANKRDVQLFIKRLRKKGFSFKYFIVSEYAPETLRPHYHGIIFSDDDITDNDLRESWKKGVTDTQEANDGSLNYVTKYLLKGNDRYGNFKLQSTRPAIGKGYINKINAIQTYQPTEDGYNTFKFPLNGKLLPMPRYFRKKLSEYISEDEIKKNTFKILNDMEKRGKHYYLEKKFNKKVEDENSSDLEKIKQFETSVRYAYNKDVEVQYSINNKKFDVYD